ncbi:MAG: M20/M25/M40 family metallo-hydrolase [Candidatus Lokiarchaeota archaeon]|nr:M20/M25/M40 family metallo-hydrolase [Candidatus Lokiarchaeota archaeon]
MEEKSKFHLRFIKKIIDTIGPRLPSSEEENKAAELIAEEFEGVTGTPSTIEEFNCAPLAAIGSIPMYGYLILFVLFPLYIFLPLVALILGLFVFFVAIAQIFRYTGWFDFMFPQKTSRNVYSIVEPSSGTVDQTILIAGHIDSSWEWNLALKNPERLWFKIPYGIIGGALVIIMALYRLITNNVTITLGNSWTIWIFIFFIPGWIYLARYLSWDKSKASPGAMDNLSGVSIALWVTDHLKKHPEKIPENTRIIVGAFGSEEAGTKGSQAFVKKHKNDLLQNMWALIVDGVSDMDYFHVVEGDTWLGTKYDDDFCSMAQEAMQEQKVLPATRIENPVGGSDSASFSRAGVRTVTLIAQNPTATDYYHTHNDTYDRLELLTLAIMDEIVLKLIQKIGKCVNKK